MSFENIQHKDLKAHDGTVKRLSMDCKATVEVGDSSRRGKSRRVVKASDHDLGDKVKYIPCGILDKDIGALHISFGQSAKTSDFMVDNLQEWWGTLTDSEQQQTQMIQLKLDHLGLKIMGYALSF